MQYHYPTPSEAGVSIPPLVRKKLFKAGFRHGLEGGGLDQIEHVRFSFRMGLRAAKLYLREVRHAQGIIEFPQRRKFRVTTHFDSRPPPYKRHKP
jgi:hypothetical protein